MSEINDHKFGISAIYKLVDDITLLRVIKLYNKTREINGLS